VVVPANTAQLILANCTNFVIQNLNISNAGRGIQLGYSSSNTISRNTVSNSHQGIHLTRSSDNQIYENTVTLNDYGIYILSWSSYNNVVYHNNITNNTQNAYADGNNQWDDGYPSGGNFWSDYDGIDADGDGIGDTPYDIPSFPYIYDQDRYPLMYPWQGIAVFVDDDADPAWYDSTHVRTIQEGIDSVTDGGAVYVYNGTYYENAIVDKQLYLIGHDMDSVIVDGGGSGDVFSLSADGALIKGFTMRNSGSYAGIVLSSDYNTIFANSLTNNGYGIYLNDSSNYNSILQNKIGYNGYGIYIADFSDSSKIYHNDFIANTQSAHDECNNIWDDGCPSGGNYWDDYTGIDANGNGLGRHTV
jgi:parallel beta-helix repeat protein